MEWWCFNELASGTFFYQPLQCIVFAPNFVEISLGNLHCVTNGGRYRDILFCTKSIKNSGRTVHTGLKESKLFTYWDKHEAKIIPKLCLVSGLGILRRNWGEKRPVCYDRRRFFIACNRYESVVILSSQISNINREFFSITLLWTWLSIERKKISHK